MAQTTPSERADGEAIDLVLVEAMERMAAGDVEALEAVCRAHPTLAGEIRERLGVLREMNLLPTDAAAMAFPSHLGEFRLLRRLGGGGMGVVYEAVQEPLSRRVALKLIRPEQLYFPRARERFRRETEAVARLSHPGIVAIHTVGEAQGTPYFAMEMVHGVSLAQALDQLGGSAPEHLTGADLRATAMAAAAEQLRETSDEVPELFVGSWVVASTRVVVKLSEALAHAHGRGILHRDIKPSNVVVTPTGRVVLLDFGLAGLESELRMTMTGTTLGSVLYMSPEQVAGRVDEIDGRTDVYALGVTLYELLTLKLPFEAKDSEMARVAILEGRVPSIRARNPEVGRDLEIVCMKALERERSRRYASMDEFGADLKRVLAGKPILARPPSAAYRTWRWVRRHPTISASIGLIALLAVSVPTALYWQQRAHARELALALEDAVGARKQADELRDHAQREALHEQEVAAFLTGMLGSGDPYKGGRRDLTARDMLALGVERANTTLNHNPELQASVLQHIGESYVNLDYYLDALPPLERALELRHERYGDDDVRTAHVMRLVGSARRLAGRPGAVPLLRKSCEVLSAHDAIRPVTLVETRVLLALSLIDAGEHDEPLAILRDVCERSHGFATEDRAQRWSTMSMTASGLLRLEEYARAEAIARETLASDGEVAVKPHPWRAAMLDILGSALRGQGRLAEAVATYDELLPEASAIYERDNPILRTMQNAAARAHAELDPSLDVEDTLRDSYEALLRRFGIDEKQTISALGFLTSYQVTRDRTDAGLELLDDALARMEAEEGRTDANVARILERIGILSGARGDTERAEQAFRRARSLGDPGQLPALDVGLAVTLVRVPERRAEAVQLASKWVDDWHAGISLAARYVLARAAFAEQRLDEAERIAREAIALPGAATDLNWGSSGCRLVLGEVQLARGDAVNGRRAVESALLGLERRLGASHATVSEARARVAR